MKIIARIQCDFKEKFGIPRQSGLVPDTRARIVFEPEYRNSDALRGIETYSHLWLIWSFSKAERDTWSPTVRPPRLGGNTRLGVFATRSPFRPNAIGLSSVTLEEVILHSPDGPVLIVGGADLLDGTPIYDIKPYLPYVDSHPDARGGFTEKTADYALHVNFPQNLFSRIDEDKRDAVLGVLAGDPRPSYQHDPMRVYGVRYAQHNIKFTVDGDRMTVVDVIEAE
ncbi:MAG: tRNA (N6-threonylcarbamoyladenosine(37)-N6)-methyltransferase TrmO [Clostridia bacterium]|nr:tRNA (N6-threonylcarbamoyladenosine(37)-N6)-methyltransferase TrmO [Clostridia bacterium]